MDAVQPGIRLPDHMRFVQLLRPLTLGDRVCAAGDVVAVRPPGAKPRAIMPVDPHLYFDRAEKLINDKLARVHPGPATVMLGTSLRRESEIAPVEQAVSPTPQRAERAVAAPQRRGAM